MLSPMQGAHEKEAMVAIPDAWFFYVYQNVYQKNFCVQVLFQVTDLNFYAANLHGTRTFQFII